MKVLLKADVKGQGKAGEVVNVSDGFARNYLLPKGLAVEANAENLNAIKIKKEAEKHKIELDRQSARELAGKLENAGVVIQAKCGEHGKLFGSITTKEIAEALQKQYHLEIDKKKIQLKDHIKETGEYKVPVKLYADVSAVLNVTVKS